MQVSAPASKSANAQAWGADPYRRWEADEEIGQVDVHACMHKRMHSYRRWHADEEIGEMQLGEEEPERR